MKLSDRMLRADTFTDGRLLRTSREARLLALVFEAVAESTGVVKNDPDEIRAAAPFYLADADGTPPARASIEAWTEELVREGWAWSYSSKSLPLLYLRGFGVRQKGANVCIGVSQTTGEIEPYLPLPPCVELIPHSETKHGGFDSGAPAPARKMLPRHCEGAESCPCERFPNPSRTPRPPEAKDKEKGTEGSAVDPEPKVKELEDREGESGGEPGAHPDDASEADLRKLEAIYGPKIVKAGVRQARDYAAKCNPPQAVTVALVRYECEDLRCLKAKDAGSS